MASDSYSCMLCGSSEYEPVVTGIKDWEFGAPGEYRYCRCSACRQVQLHPFPSLDQLKAAYPPTYPVYIAAAGNRGILYSLLYNAKGYLIRKRLGALLKPGARVLDVGCGNGDFLHSLRTLDVTDVHGIDFSAHAVALARQKGIQTYDGLFLDYPATAASFDAVFMNHYLEHVVDLRAELRKAKSLLRVGGLLLGECPNFGCWDRRFFSNFWGGNHVPRHTYQFDKCSLRRLLSDAGFSNIRVRSRMDTSEIAVSLQNWMQRNVDDLANNPRLICGRVRTFGLLLVLLIPLGMISFLGGHSSVMSFEAEA